jgi:hypothetical protein
MKNARAILGVILVAAALACVVTNIAFAALAGALSIPAGVRPGWFRALRFVG